MNAYDDAQTSSARATAHSEHGLNSPEKVENPLTDADLELVLGGLVETPDEPADALADLTATEALPE